MKRLCLIYNFAPKYREAIYKLIDSEYDCHWVFGNYNTDIKGLDLSVLKDVEEVDTVQLFGNWTWRKNTLGLLKKYDTFLNLGDVYCLSTWVLAFLAKFRKGKKVYFWSHGWYGRESFLKKLLKKAFFSLADGTFLYGNYAKKLMTENGFDENKLFVIHNSLDYGRQLELRNCISQSDIYQKHFGNSYKTIIFIGRLTETKRLDMLINAVSILHDKGEFYNVVLVGDGEKRESLENFAKAKSIPVWFYGACYDEKENAELIYNADLCVSPGNVGLTAIHTMMFGTPVITHSDFTNQVPEFETIRVGKTGAFFNSGSVESLVKAIGDWFGANGELREEVRKDCYHEIDNYWTPQFQMDVIKKVII